VILHLILQSGAGSRLLITKKERKKGAAEKNEYFLIENFNLLIHRPSERTPSYRRSIQLSKEIIQHLKI
jgi:hypothetical protein